MINIRTISKCSFTYKQKCVKLAFQIQPISILQYFIYSHSCTTINNRYVDISSLKMKRKLGSICVEYMEKHVQDARKCKKVKPESMTVTLQMLNANFCINVNSPFEMKLVQLYCTAHFLLSHNIFYSFLT